MFPPTASAAAYSKAVGTSGGTVLQAFRLLDLTKDNLFVIRSSYLISFWNLK